MSFEIFESTGSAYEDFPNVSRPPPPAFKRRRTASFGSDEDQVDLRAEALNLMLSWVSACFSMIIFFVVGQSTASGGRGAGQ